MMTRATKTRTRDAEATKEAILKAAEALFAQKGFAGTPIREISKQSGVSGPLILFHFQSKDGLYEAVKAAIMGRYQPIEAAASDDAQSVYEFLRTLIDSIFAFYRDNPTMLRLANWDRLEGVAEPWPGEDELHHAFEDYLARAQKKGDIRADIPPINIMAMIFGAVHVWWEYHPHYLKHADERGVGSQADQDYADQLLALVWQGLSTDESIRAPGITKVLPTEK